MKKMHKSNKILLFTDRTTKNGKYTFKKYMKGGAFINAPLFKKEVS